MQAANKVAFNTFVMYAKMLITMGISLYSTRLVLNALGATDYGVYMLIAGVIAMLSFLNSAMATSTLRYFSFYQGKNDLLMQKKVFTNSYILHIAIAIFVVMLLLVLIPFLFNGFLNIQPDRIPAARFVYCFMAISVFFSIISVPFNASIAAHENMLWLAVIYTIENLLKFAIAISLVMFAQNDRLFIYGLLMSIVALCSFIIYLTYCKKKYEECHFQWSLDIPLIKELFAFSGWNFYGVLCNIGKIQGLAVLLNIFGGTIVNAAYGIANQVSVQLNFFSRTMIGTMNPQIMKSEGMNNRKRTLRLSMTASKFGFFLLAFIAVPCIFEMPAILKIWLNNVPENTVIFCSLFLVGALITQLTFGIQSAIQAIGKIKLYQTIIGTVLLLNLPISYILLKFGFPVYSVMISFVLIEIMASTTQLILIKKIACLSIKEYFNRVFLREIVPVLLLIISCWTITHTLFFDYRFIVTGMVSVIIFAAGIYFTGLCKDEKNLVDKILKKILRKT